MQYDTKIALIIRDDLLAWQKLNATAFLAGGLVGAVPEIAGAPYRDASGVGYGPLIRQPVMVFAGSGDDLKKVLNRALSRGLIPALYTLDLFSTMSDADNRAAVEAFATEDLDLAGLALHAERKMVDKVIKGLKLHP